MAEVWQIDGEAFTVFGEDMPKPDAKRHARTLRKQRYKARVVRKGGKWAVLQSRTRSNASLTRYR